VESRHSWPVDIGPEQVPPPVNGHEAGPVRGIER
jgi:hypothetical protein